MSMDEDKQPSPDTPLRLKDAVKWAFPLGGMTVSGLRREAARGRLAIELIAGKQFTTLRAIAEMREKCRDSHKAPDCGSGRPSKAKTASPAKPHGLSETARASAARAALEKTAKELKKRLQTTLPTSTASPRVSATVIPLKSS